MANTTFKIDDMDRAQVCADCADDAANNWRTAAYYLQSGDIKQAINWQRFAASAYRDSRNMRLALLAVATPRPATPVKIELYCVGCGGTNVTRDATVSWSVEKQDFEFIGALLDNCDCNDCGGDYIEERPIVPVAPALQKFTVKVRRMVQEMATVVVEAASASEARDLVLDSDIPWHMGNDVEDAECYAVRDASGKQVWECW